MFYHLQQIISRLTKMKSLVKLTLKLHPVKES